MKQEWGCGLGEYIGWFKTMTTNECIKQVRNGRFRPFDRKMWQRNYYERIIRDEHELCQLRQYITNNPRSCS